VGHPSEGAITLSINGELRQQGDLNELIWSVPEVISMLSESFELKAGDLIFTGTPAGVGPLQRGDRIEGAIAGLGTLGITLSSD
jgi:fumarylpyruvate hydrolase